MSEEILTSLEKLNSTERIELFSRFKNDFYSYLFVLQTDKLSLDQYNAELEKSENDITHGRFLSQNAFETKVETWLRK